MLLSILSVISFLTCTDSDESVVLSIFKESLPYYFFSPLKILGVLHGTHPTGLAKKKPEFQVVLWASSSRILLSQGHFWLVLVNDFIRG